MIIDFHTHVFPDVLAPKTIPYLAGLCGIAPSTDGTLSGLRSSMKDAGIHTSIVLPVVTKPAQFDSIQQFAAQINTLPGIVSFGGIHPDCTDIPEKVAHIASLGLKGIKLHPDYQSVNADDPRYVEIVSEAIKAGLIVVFHAGVDIGLPEPNYSTPEMFVRLIEALDVPLNAPSTGNGALVLAHTGGFRFWDQVEALLVGKPVYFDISFSSPYISDQQLVRIIQTHGSHRILFGTDCPWSRQKEYVEHFRSLPLSDAEKERILWKNAAQLLQMPIQ